MIIRDVGVGVVDTHASILLREKLLQRCGCSNRWSTRPEAKKTPEAYPLGYVEDFFETRTKLGACFSSRLEFADGAL